MSRVRWRSTVRVLGHGEGVEVDDAEHRGGGGLVGHEAAQGAQVGAEGELARGLDAGEDAGPRGAMVGGQGARYPALVPETTPM